MSAPQKHIAHLDNDVRVAYVDEGLGTPVLLLHGCPFSSFVWRDVIDELSAEFRCIAPDLLGLGDTETPANADWSLRAQLDSVVALMDDLGLGQVAVVGHDQGAAIAQLLAAQHPNRVNALVLANAEAYDNWPSCEELPFIRATQLLGLGRLVLWTWSRRSVFRWALARGEAVHDRAALTDELVDGYIAANFATAHRRRKTRRFLATQLDPANQSHTADVVAALAHFEPPAMILWGARDVHFGTEWAERLHHDIGSASRLEILSDAGHLLMEEQPARIAALIAAFLHDHGRVG